jgi:hypothetical protein
MAWVTLRCPKCGAYVGAPAYPTLAPSWVTCPHCATPLPVVAPRDPPPLFTWEAFPGVYPPLPTPRVPSARIHVITALLLASLTVLLAVLAGLLGGTGIAAGGPATYQLAGTVVTEGGEPLGIVATVHVEGENGFNETVTTGLDDRFDVPGVPAGGALLNVSAPSYEATLFSVFLSPVYSSTSDPGALMVTMVAGSSLNATTEGSPVYGDMEGFLTGIWSGAGVLGIAAAAAGLAAIASWRRLGPTWVVAGSAGAAVVPFAVVELGLASAFPDLEWPLFALVAAGVTALTLGSVQFAWSVAPEADR